MNCIKDIKWDTDGDQEVFDSLPQEIALPEKFSMENYRDDDGNYGAVEREARLEDISDWLSDEYGFCHGGFTLSEEPEDLVETNIGSIPQEDYENMKN